MAQAGKRTIFFAIAFGLMAIVSVVTGRIAFAATDIPVEIIPRCSSVEQHTSYYEVINKNDENVTIDYVNASASATGTFVATPGTSALYVGYNAIDPNNTTSFTYQRITTQTNANVGTTCDASQLPGGHESPATPTDPTIPGQGSGTTEPATCVDGTDASNLSVVWNNNSQITINTKSNLPLCNDLTLYYSTYRMPSNYDNQGFSVANTTSYPQTMLQSYELNLAAGTYGLWIKNVPLPDYCYNTQADIYYGPEVTAIGGDALGYHADGTPISSGVGHGAQNIKSVVFLKDPGQCVPGRGAGFGNGIGGFGAGSLPGVLPETGPIESQIALPAAIGAMIGGTTLLGAGFNLLRRR